MVDSGLRHSKSLVESHVSYAEIIGLISDERDTKFGRWHVVVGKIDLNIKDLADNLEQHMGNYENTGGTADIPVNVL